MALELLSLLCIFENSTKCSKVSSGYRSIEILFRIAKRSIVTNLAFFLKEVTENEIMHEFPSQTSLPSPAFRRLLLKIVKAVNFLGFFTVNYLKFFSRNSIQRKMRQNFAPTF